MKWFAIGVLWLCGAHARAQEQNATPLGGDDGSAFRSSAAASVNQATGAVRYSAPVSSITDGALTIALTADYASQGHLLYDLGGSLGLGWRLNTGGSLTREIRGLPDDHEVGRWTGRNPYDDDVDGRVYDSRQEVLDLERDAEYDLLRYTAGAHAGAFIVNADGVVRQIPQTDCRIEPILKRDVPVGFTITTPEGVAYRFGGELSDGDDAWDPLAICVKHPVGDGWEAVSGTSSWSGYYPTSYLLGSVTDMNGSEIAYTYREHQFSSDLAASAAKAYSRYEQLDSDCPMTTVWCEPFSDQTHLRKASTLLTKLTAKSSGEVVDLTYVRTPVPVRPSMYMEPYVLDQVRKNVGPHGQNVKFEYDLFQSWSRPEEYYAPTGGVQLRTAVGFGPEEILYKPALTKIIPFGAWPADGGGDLPHYSFSYNEMMGLSYWFPLYRRLDYEKSSIGYYWDRLIYHDYAGFARDATGPYGIPRVTLYGKTYGSGDREPNHAEAAKTLLKEVTTPTGQTTSYAYEPNDRSIYQHRRLSRTITCDSRSTSGSSYFDCDDSGRGWMGFKLNAANAATSAIHIAIAAPVGTYGSLGIVIRKKGQTSHTPSFSWNTSGETTEVSERLVKFLEEEFGSGTLYGDYEFYLTVGGYAAYSVEDVRATVTIELSEWLRNEPVPGLRVASITRDDHVGSPAVTAFRYSLSGEESDEHSSGVTRGRPRFGESDGEVVKLTSESLASLPFSSGSIILYGAVTQHDLGNGRVTSSFDVPTALTNAQYAPMTPATVYDPAEGRLTSIAYYDEGSDEPYRSDRFAYYTDPPAVYPERSWRVYQSASTIQQGPRAIRSEAYAYPTTRRPRVRSVTSLVDGDQRTVTRYTYHPDLVGPYVERADVDLPDGTSSYSYTGYTIDYPSSAIGQAMSEANFIAVPYDTYSGKDDQLHVRTKHYYEFFTASGYPRGSSASDGPLALRRVWRQRRAVDEAGAEVTGSSVNRWEFYVNRVFPDGIPRVFKPYQQDLWTTLTRLSGTHLLSRREIGNHRVDFEYHDGLLREETGADGVVTSYEYDAQNRLERVTNGCTGGYTEYAYRTASPEDGDLASVEVTTVPWSGASKDIAYTTYDGAGRKIQTVAVGRSASTPTAGANGRGYVHARTEYDRWGRVEKVYVPRTRNRAFTGKGCDLIAASTSARWTEYDYEDSPRSRLRSVLRNNGYVTNYVYGYSLGTVSGAGYPSTFASRRLATVRAIDHEDYVTQSYRDSWGNVVRRERYASGGGSVFDEVNYGYDVKNQLMRVVPGDESVGIDERHYRYTYDAYGRTLSKTIPGEGVTEFAYRPNDRLVGMQTPHTRQLSGGEQSWAYLYDAYGEVVKTGLIAGGARYRTSLSSGELVGERRVSYSKAQSLDFGRVLSERTRMLDGDREWVATTYAHDDGDCGRVSGTVRSGLPGLPASATVSVDYDAEGRERYTESVYPFPGHNLRARVTPAYTDDHAVDRLHYRLDAGASAGSRASKFSADLTEVEHTSDGDLRYKRVDKRTGRWLQDIDYHYDAIGRLTQINQPLYGESYARGLYRDADDGTVETRLPHPMSWIRSDYQNENRDIFFERIRYEGRTPGAAFTNATHSGLIQETIKSVQGRRPVLESYGYDDQLRLARYQAWELSGSDVTAVERYAHANHAQADYLYDDTGRPTQIRRWGYSEGSNPRFGRFDQLSYEYKSGGDEFRIRKIRDYSYGSQGHKDHRNTSGYSHNAAGAVTYDGYKGLRYRYNALGRVSQVERAWGEGAGSTSTYRYSADGVLRESEERDGQGRLTGHIYYVDGHRYDAVADEVYVASPEGATLLDADNDAIHVRYHVDHLGNVVLAYADLDGDGVVRTATAEVLEESRYYPYGMKLAGYVRVSTRLPFAYNGAEEDERFGLHLTTFRTMAPETGLWTQVDPKAELMYGVSPYSAMAGNPISYADPHGDAIPAFLVGAIIGAVGGGISGYGQDGWDGAWKGALIGAGAGAIGAGIGNGVAASLHGGTFASGLTGQAVQSAGFIAGFKAGAAGGAAGGFASGFANELVMNDGSFGSALGAGGIGAASGSLLGGLAGGLQGGAYAKKHGRDYLYGDKLTDSGSFGVAGAGQQLQENSCACNIAEIAEGKFQGTRTERDFIAYAKRTGLLGEKGVDGTRFFKGAGFNTVPVSDFGVGLNSQQLAQHASKGNLLVGALNNNHSVMLSGWETYSSGRLNVLYIDPARGGNVFNFRTLPRLNRLVQNGWLLKP